MREESRFHGQPEFVTPGGIDSAVVVHPCHIHLALLTGAGGLVRRRRGSGESDEGADAFREEGGGCVLKAFC